MKIVENLLKVKSIVALALTIGMILMLTGVFQPPEAVFEAYKMAYVSVITYFFTKRDTKSEG